MPLGVTIITFSPNTLIRSADVNSNFSALNNASVIQGQVVGNATSATNATVGTTQLSTSGGTVGAIINTSGVITSQIAGGLLDFAANKYQAFSHFGGTGSGTYNHNWLGGVTPNMLDVDPINTAAVSWAGSSGGTTTLVVTLSAAVSFNADVSLIH